MSLPPKKPAHTPSTDKRTLGRGVFRKCKGCGAVRTAEQFRETWEVCTDCGHHHTLPSTAWQELLLDQPLEAWDEHISPADPLGFDDGTAYPIRLERSLEATGCSEAIQVGRGRIFGRSVAFGCFVFQFMGGSMGSVVGERITRLFERARAERLAVILLHASGGARMQEGILSLMQMAKTVAALQRYREIRRPFFSVMLNPTTGGVAASTAMLGDINLAEPRALIGFAGPRVIENTLRTKLPEGFQRSEFLLEHGMLDCVIPRSRMRSTLGMLLNHLDGDSK